MRARCHSHALSLGSGWEVILRPHLKWIFLLRDALNLMKRGGKWFARAWFAVRALLRSGDPEEG